MLDEGTACSRGLVKELIVRAVDESSWKVQLEEDTCVMEEAVKEYKKGHDNWVIDKSRFLPGKPDGK